MKLQTSLHNALIAAAFAAALTAATASHAAVTISTDATANMNCSAGICTPTDKTANLNVGDLQTMLASSDVTVKTGAGAISIGVGSPLTWTSTHRLTLDSIQFIHIKAPVVVEGTAGLTITTNDGGSGGDLVFENGGYVNFWDLGSSLVINGASYTLVGDIHRLASDITANPSGDYALAKSYDASVDGTYPSAPISTPFQGTFEGLGNTLSGLKIDCWSVATDIGLFAVSAGVLRDLTIRSVAVSSSRPEVIAGGLAGDNWGSIIGVTVSGKVVSSGSLGVAGMVAGTNSGHVAEVNVSGKSSGPHAGGLVGENTFGGIVENSASTGTVTGGIAGGAVGINRNTIRLLWASGVVHGGTAGGLVGENEQGTVGRSYASGTVEGHRAGGLIGLQDENALAEQCYAIGAVTSVGRRPETAAGLIGDARGKTLECYATGAISGVHTGGFVADAESDAAFRHDYWDIATTGQSTGTMDGNLRGIDGLTDGQLKATLPDGFNPRVWGQDPNINNGWPYLLANPPQ